MRLEDWAVVVKADRYTPPEVMRECLSGKVFGHYKYPDGDEITTSYIVKVEGRRITTYSGSVYLLGQPSVGYVQWCMENGVAPPSEEEPIRLIKPPAVRECHS